MIKNSGKKTAVDILSVVSLISVVFVFLEIIYPFYYLSDDNFVSYMPYYVYAYKSLLSGKLGIYSFHQFMGEPVLAMGQTGTLNPLVYISCAISEIFFGSFKYVMEIMGYIHLIIGGVGTYLLLKKMNVNRIVSIVGAVAFTLNTFTIYLGSQWMVVSLISAFLPWMVYSSLNYMQKADFKNIALCVFFKVCMVFTGHPQFYIYAFLIECVMMISFVLTDERMSCRYFARKAGQYTLVYVPVLILSLPILVPMASVASMSIQRADKLPFEEYASGQMSILDYVLGNVAFYSEFIKVSFASHITHISIVLFLAGLVGVAYLVKNYRKKEESVRWLKVMFCPALVSVLWSSTTIALKLIYLIPVLNRFRMPFKLSMFWNFFAILSACVILSRLIETVKKESAKKLASGLLIILVLADFISVYAYDNKHSIFVIDYDSGSIDHEVECDELLSGRFILLNTGANMEETGNYYGFNHATYYGINNYYGYGVMVPEVIYSEEFEDVSSSFLDVGRLSEFKDIFARRGVNLYILPAEKDEMYREELCGIGLTEKYRYEKYVLYEDLTAKPLVYDSLGEVTSYQDVNSVFAETENSFTGGNVTFNYVYNPNFKAFVDGGEVDVLPVNSGENMSVNVPSGKHSVEIRYCDSKFVVCMTISIICLLLFPVTIILYKSKIKINKKEKDLNV